MPLFLPFRRAGVHEKVLQISAYSIAVGMALLVVAPFIYLFILSFGDVSDAWALKKWPDLRHLVDSKRMYTHYVAAKWDYFAEMNGFNERYGRPMPEGAIITNFEGDLRMVQGGGNWKARARDGYECLKTMPWSHQAMLFTGWGYRQGGTIMTAYTGLGEIAWKSHLRRKYGDVTAINLKFGTGFESFSHVILPSLPNMSVRGAYPFDDEQTTEYIEFLSNRLEPAMKSVWPSEWAYQNWLKLLPEFKGDIARLNKVMGTSCSIWGDIAFPETLPVKPVAARYWKAFVFGSMNSYLLEIINPVPLQDKYRKFLAKRHGTADGVTAIYGVPCATVSLPATAHELPASATAYYDWDAYVHALPPDAVRVRTAESIWRRFLESKYNGSIDALNRAFGTGVGSFDQIPWPQPEMDHLDWEKHKFAYVSEILLKNYRRVWSWITEGTSAASVPKYIPDWLDFPWRFLTGGAGALWNTALFALIFTVMAVMINTGAAYVLSRYAMGPFQMLLVYFLALAAFPIEAIAVPNFLLLRNLGLLNSVWALVLPTVVNGYYIYLMKGFFDTIPRDYYEEATIYGAGEWSLFWRVALPFAKPMMAVVGLYAFLWSYSNFMWSLIVCQQRIHWTLPVFVFNMSTWLQPPCIIAASMVLTLLPPLLVFAFSHRTLQRALTLPKS